MSDISMDIKYMIDSTAGYKFILFACCNITRYVVGYPLKKTDAPSVAEVLVKLVLQYGPPTQIIMDKDSAFKNSLTKYIYDALKIKTLTVSPFHHSSLKVERQIGSVSRLLTTTLSRAGRSWPALLQSAIYSYNTSPLCNFGFSPHYLVYLREPPSMSDLDFKPITDVTRGLAEYAKVLKERLTKVSTYVLDIQTKLQQNKQGEMATKVQQPYRFRIGSITYLLAPNITSLLTSSKKITAHFVGPLVIRDCAGNSKYLLMDTRGRHIHGVFHHSRLKPGFIRAGTKAISHIDELKREINIRDFDKIATPIPLSVSLTSWVTFILLRILYILLFIQSLFFTINVCNPFFKDSFVNFLNIFSILRSSSFL